MTPKYFPKASCQMVIGLVSKSSSVPAFSSSERLRIVIAGIRKVNIQGASSKNGAKLAKPLFGILKSPSKTQRNSPVAVRNRPITKYPIGEVKKVVISFLKRAINGLGCFELCKATVVF